MVQDLLRHCDAHELHRIWSFTHDGWRTLFLGFTNRVARTVFEVHTNYLRHRTVDSVGQLLENLYLYLSIYLYLYYKRAKELKLASHPNTSHPPKFLSLRYTLKSNLTHLNLPS
jgi:hypothetical protein